jgi:hypothetical protein
MKYIQFLSIEIGRACNYAKLHEGYCPSIDCDRYGNLDTTSEITNDEILDVVRQSYKMGFNGFIAFHYYNEPMLFIDRIEIVIQNVKNEFENAKFCLWTNGSKIDENLDKMKLFDSIYITQYVKNKQFNYVRNYMKDSAKIVTLSGNLDNRRKNFKINNNLDQCVKPFNELIIDIYGNAHMCCMDWKGEIELGNIKKNDFVNIHEKFFKIREQLITNPISDNSPSICKKCMSKTPTLNFINGDEKVMSDSKEYIEKHKIKISKKI